MYCAKTVEPIKMPFSGVADSWGSKEPCSRIDGGQYWTNPFAVTIVTSQQCGLLLNHFGHLSICQGWARDVKARDRDDTFVGHETSPRR